MEAPFFGTESTRETLANSVSSLVNMALPEDAEGITFWPTDWATKYVAPAPEDYLRIAIISSGRQQQHPIARTVHSPPVMSWDFVHPELPIIKVVADYEISLPWRSQEDTEYMARTESEWTKETMMTIGFVISFQHRWNSFDEPNRWAVKYADCLTSATKGPEYEPYDLRQLGVTGESQTWTPRNGTLDPELEHLYPNYWHASDYMQHSLVGPVVMTVHESLTLNEGTYSITPEVTAWEAPGPILEPEQLWAPPVYLRSLLPEGQEPERYQQKYPFFNSVNAGYPLPGHLLTMSYSQPGTKVWESYDLGPEWEYPVP